jgi:ABC-type dipeptide/oligopeptide/nickel transport system permease subunit
VTTERTTRQQGNIRVLIDSPWLSVAPGLAILMAVLAFNLVGDALRDVIDPRLRV